MSAIFCPCCRKAMGSTRKKCLGYRWMRCKNCRHWMLDMPEERNRTYQRKYHLYHPDKEGQEVAEVRRDFLLEHVTTRGSVIDIGCGAGYLLSKMTAWPGRVGLDTDATITKQWNSSEIRYLQEDFLKYKPRDQYDLVMAWHVLEHIRDAGGAFAQLVALCRPDGWLAFELPVDRHLSLAVYHGHIHSFGTTSVAALLRKHQGELTYHHVGLGVLWPAVLVLAQKQKSRSARSDLLELCAKGGKAATRAWRRDRDGFRIPK